MGLGHGTERNALAGSVQLAPQDAICPDKDYPTALEYTVTGSQHFFLLPLPHASAQVSSLEDERSALQGRVAELQAALANKAAEMADTVFRLKQVIAGARLERSQHVLYVCTVNTAMCWAACMKCPCQRHLLQDLQSGALGGQAYGAPRSFFSTTPCTVPTFPSLFTSARYLHLPQDAATERDSLLRSYTADKEALTAESAQLAAQLRQQAADAAADAAERYGALEAEYGELRARWEAREPRPEDLKRIAELEAVNRWVTGCPYGLCPFRL